jgi:hypothetical protein
MGLAWMMALQLAAPEVPVGIVPVDFDLAEYRPDEGCGSSSGSTIVVCGRRPSGGDYPFEAMAKLFEQKRIVAETKLVGGVTARAFVQRVELPQDQVSNRVMVGLKLPF